MIIPIPSKTLESAQRYLSDLLLSDANLLLSAALVALVAIIAGLGLTRLLKRENPKNTGQYFANFMSGLMPPLCTLLAMAGIASYAHNHAASPEAFYFFFKLAMAWLVARFVYSFTSKQEAGWIVTLILLPLAIAYMLGITGDISEILDSLSIKYGNQKFTALMVVKGLSAIIVLFWFASRLMQILTGRINRMSGIHLSHRTLIAKTLQIFLYFMVFIIALQIVGVDLTALSVFGGALGVGLGFGLQKIASNFISGIILLMERSIEVGDLVELADGTIGFIRKTGARYTLMETPDCRDILIPNEEFITQRSISWTHSNQTGRVVVDVGVSYDSDLELVQQLMLEAAMSHPRCLKHPAPLCILNNFADSSVNFTLYFFIDHISQGRMEPRSEVMFNIWHAFKEHGVEIPYPQRVVHHYHTGGSTSETISGAIDA